MEINKNNKKRAMTMAEIIIVVVIVAIVASIFIAMPKKNVSKLDKAKYYVAYNMLQNLQNEILANGTVGNELTEDRKIDYNNFAQKIEPYLNTISVSDNILTLTNGMILNTNFDVNNTETITSRDGAEFETCTGVGCTTPLPYKEVTIDIDGSEQGESSTTHDVHRFWLYSDGLVRPCFVEDLNKCDDPDNIAKNFSGNNWINFKVYSMGDNGNIEFVNGCSVMNKDGIQSNAICSNVPYQSARNKYLECMKPNVATVDAANHIGTKDCFMEANPPLK